MSRPTFTTGPAVRRAAEALGSQQAIAKLLNVSEAFVSYMARGSKAVPVDRVETLADASGIPAWELRPDRFERPQA